VSRDGPSPSDDDHETAEAGHLDPDDDGDGTSDADADADTDDEKAKMLRGDLYDPLDPQLRADHATAQELTALYNATGPRQRDQRRAILEELFGDLGDHVTVEPPIRCDYGYNVSVGDGFFANFGCVFLDVCPITIGDRVMLGPGVHLYPPTHPIDAEARAEGLEAGEPITVGDDVWIGGRAVLNAGVTVGDRAVIGSGSVVTRDVPADVVVGGNPARVIREIE
jgi:maltose O-acetyltransferase